MQTKINAAAAFIAEKITNHPEVALILGTGLGDLAEKMENPVFIPYSDIPHFPVSTVPEHKGQLVFGKLSGKEVLAMQGRFHYYEGYSMQTLAFPVQVFAKLHIKKLIVSAAVGAINPDFIPGDIMAVTDHIKLTADCPLRGANIPALGERYFDMSEAYDKKLIEIANSAALKCGITIKHGVYAFMGGPNFETPAEIKMLKILGADVVGMSTVPEVLAARHAGIKVLALSFCSNMASGVSDRPQSQEEVLETARDMGGKFSALVSEIVRQM